MRFLHILSDLGALRVIKPLYFSAQEYGGVEQVLYISGLVETLLDKSLPLVHDLEDARKFKPDVVFSAGKAISVDLPGVKVNLFRNLYDGRRSYFKIGAKFDLYCTSGPFITGEFMRLARKRGDFLVAQSGWTAADSLFTPFDKREIRRRLKLNPDGTVVVYAPSRFSSSGKMKKRSRILNEIPNKDEEWVICLSDIYQPVIIEKLFSLDRKKFRVLAFPDPSDLYQAADMLVTDSPSQAFEFMLLDKPVVFLGNRGKAIQELNPVDFPDLRYVVDRSLENPEESVRQRKDIIDKIHPYKDGKSCNRVLNVINEICSRKLYDQLKPSHSGFLKGLIAKWRG